MQIRELERQLKYEKLKEFYEKLVNQSSQIADAANEALQSSLNSTNMSMKAVNNIRENVEFMNQMNMMFNYIQLPLKLSNSQAHGDLYVYNKNRGKIVDKDVITAFMHLDMEYLGATDINIRLEKNSLNTTFSIADDLSVQIIDEHLYELKERLEKAGFIVSLSVTRENKEITPFEEMLETDKPKISIKRYSFDVRA